MNSDLPDPISSVLEDTADEARVRRNWRAIEEKQKRPRSNARVYVISAVAAAAAIAIFFAWPRGTETIASGPLRLANGNALAATERTVSLADGSRIVIEEGRIEPLQNRGDVITLLLARGTARFEVEPGGPRTWTIETGVASVEVVGTIFTVSRGEGWARVEVERGVVVVRGERVPDRAARLTAGETLMVGEERTTAVAPTSAGTTDTPAPERALVPRPRREPQPDENADALMAQADEARRAGRTSDAIALLERAMARENDPAAGVAAFTLGRLEARPDRAAFAFSRALELTLPPRLREDASARLVDAHMRAGDRPSARAAAEAYLREYPEGRHAERVREALADP